MSEMKNAFDVLNALNVNEHTETKKNGGQQLTYLSWTWAWSEVKKRYPTAQYKIWRDERGLPFSYDPATGYMVFTSVTIDGVMHDMWLPVMDGANKAMKAEPYEYSTKFNGKKRVEAATMMDINKAIMRCLTKNLAMFGLGLYIYAGEDLPEESDEDEAPVQAKKPAKKAEPKPEPKPAAETKCEKAEPAAETHHEPEKNIGCDICGLHISGVTGKGGAWLDQEQIIRIGQKRYGKNLCAACQRSMAAKENGK